ncbi:MAG: hypothetical protein HC896_10195 [Bacteroidales bacterium]|nr:hypothetical protein [Bacteroidales bacterium]
MVQAIYVPDAGKSTFIGAQRIICDPALGAAPNGRCRRIYVAVGGYGLYKSEDGGENWAIVYTLAENRYFTDVEFSQGTVFMAARDVDLHLYDGTTLTESNLNQTRLFDIAVSPSNKNKVFACTNGMADLYRSTDGGLNFVQLLPTSDDAVGQSYFKSSLAPWKENSKLRDYLSVGELQLDPYNSDRLWFAEGMGVWRADDASNSNNGPVFNDVSAGIEEMVATDIAVSSSHVTFMTWDRIGFSMPKGQLSAYPTKQTLNTVDFSTGTSVDVSPDGNFMAAVASDHRGCCGNGDFAGYSEDGGVNWSRFGSINQTNNTNNPSQLEFGELSISATDNSNMVWISRRNTSTAPYYDTRIYYTDNQGASWTAASVPSGYNNSGFMFLTSKKVMTADRVLGGTFYSYAWNPGTIYKSTDKGHTWAKTTASLPSNAWHVQLKAAPGKAGHVWMVTGYDHREPVAQRGMWYSTDGANNFNKVTNVQDAWSLGFGAAYNGSDYPTIYIFGKINNQWGVYRSIDQAASWELITTYPLGLFDKVTCMEGDPDIFGRVYLGFSGNSFVYGQISAGSQPVEEVVIKPETLALYETESYNLVGIVKPFDATDQSLTWTSSDPSIASITSQGTLTALAQGTATISATATNGVVASAVVTVNETFRVTGINIPQSSIEVA